MNYFLKQYPDKKFTDKMDLIRFAKKNMRELIWLKKSEIKENVGIGGLNLKKIEPEINVKTDMIKVKAVINTTNIIDNHMDLHSATTFKKTVADNPTTFHLQEHQALFSHIISSNAKQYNEIMNFKDLGLQNDFPTVANINEFVLEKGTNELMFKKYANGEVTAHSVGMRYINLSFAYADEEDEKEMNYFNEKIKEAVNPEIGLENGFFWYISEAQKREGSAVVFASNSVTPALYVKDFEPSEDTQRKPSEDTSKKERDFLLTDFNF